MGPKARQRVALISKELGIHIANLMWFADFTAWYKSRHRNRSVKFVNPYQPHNGMALEICQHRARVYERDLHLHPARCTRSTRFWRQSEVVWITRYHIQRALKQLPRLWPLDQEQGLHLSWQSPGDARQRCDPSLAHVGYQT
jgi:hypothetical protein